MAAWPLRFQELGAVETPVRIVVSTGTPPPLRTAAEQLSGRLRGSEVVELVGERLPQLVGAAELAASIGEMLGKD